MRPNTGRNYVCVANNTSSSSNQPDERPDLWVVGGLVGATPWQISNSYIPGNTVAFDGVVYTCILSHDSTNGNRPEDHIEYWTDLGVDGGFATAGIFLRPALSAYHDSDADKDGSIDAQEYNYFGFISTGTAGGYNADATSYTGFRRNTIPEVSNFHTADLTQDGSFNAADIARVAVLYAAGSYHVDPSGVDGFSPGIDASSDGVELERFQQTIDRRTINRESVWCQVSVSNTQGAFKIRSLAIEAQPGNRVNSTHS